MITRILVRSAITICLSTPNMGTQGGAGLLQGRLGNKSLGLVSNLKRPLEPKREAGQKRGPVEIAS